VSFGASIEVAAVQALITGATGFIGARLLREGDRALVRAVGNIPNAIAGDLLEPASLAVACNDIETVFHCAGYAHAFSSSDPDTHWRVNFEGTRNLVNAAGEAGVKRFIFLSSVKAMAEPGDECVDEDWRGEPVTPYGKAKRAAEDAVLEAGAKYGMHVVNLRLAMVYGHGGRGNLERMACGIRAGWFPPLPETGNRRSLVHVDDVVAAMRLVAEAPAANGRTYIVADPHAYSGRQIYDAIRAAVSPAPTLRWSVPAGLLRAGGALGDALGVVLRRPLPMNSEVVDRLLGSACYSPARIERELGWRARVGLAEGVREMLSSPK
jgi:UDP-glucose 4-epimerase